MVADGLALDGLESSGSYMERHFTQRLAMVLKFLKEGGSEVQPGRGSGY